MNIIVFLQLSLVKADLLPRDPFSSSIDPTVTVHRQIYRELGATLTLSDPWSLRLSFRVSDTGFSTHKHVRTTGQSHT